MQNSLRGVKTPMCPGVQVGVSPVLGCASKWWMNGRWWGAEGLEMHVPWGEIALTSPKDGFVK